jgi:hypothetical protein
MEGGQRGTHIEIYRLASYGSKSGLGFLVWPEDWRRCDDGWCTWHHHRGCVRDKLKTDGSMQRVASDPATLPLPFLMY